MITQTITWLPIPKDAHFEKDAILTDGNTTKIGVVIGRHAYDRVGRIVGFHPTHHAEIPVPAISESQGAVQNGTCQKCGRKYDDIQNGPCPSDDCPSNEIVLTQKQFGSYGNGIDPEGNTWTCWTGNIPSKCILCEEEITAGFVKLKPDDKPDWKQVICEGHILWLESVSASQ